MSEGRWTPSPHVERETTALRRRLTWEGNLNVWIAGGSLSVAFVTGLLALGRWTHFASWLEIVLLTLASLAMGALTVWVALRDSTLKGEAKAADRERRGELGRGVGWLVDLIVLQGDAPTGSDRGMLWFEEGRLCFSGDRTSFALARDQVLPSRRVGAVPGLRHGVRLPLDHHTAAGRLALSIGTSKEEALRGSTDRWDAPPRPVEGQLPPTSLGPGAPRESRLLASAFAMSVVWSMPGLVVLTLIVDALIAPTLALVALFFLFVGLGPIFGLPLRWRAWRDRRRLGRGP